MEYEIFQKKKIIEDIKKQVGKDKVICGLSGGVDSTVTAALINSAIGKNLICVFVDTGLMRENEGKEIKNLFQKNFKIKLKVINSANNFFSKLKGKSDPEKKKKNYWKRIYKNF